MEREERTPEIIRKYEANKERRLNHDITFAFGENPGSIVNFVEMDPIKTQELERTGKVVPFHRETMPHRNLVVRKITEREVLAAGLLASATTLGYVAWRKGWIRKMWELVRRAIYSGQRLNI